MNQFVNYQIPFINFKSNNDDQVQEMKKQQNEINEKLAQDNFLAYEFYHQNEDKDYAHQKQLERNKKFKSYSDYQQEYDEIKEMLELKEKDIIEQCKYQITEEDKLNEILANNQTVLVKFYANWCASCGKLGPRLQYRCHKDKKWALVSVNVEQSQKLSEKYGIDRVPIVKLFRQGEQPIDMLVKQPETFKDYYKLANSDDFKFEYQSYYEKYLKKLEILSQYKQFQEKIQKQEVHKQKDNIEKIIDNVRKKYSPYLFPKMKNKQKTEDQMPNKIEEENSENNTTSDSDLDLSSSEDQ